MILFLLIVIVIHEWNWMLAKLFFKKKKEVVNWVVFLNKCHKHLDGLFRLVQFSCGDIGECLYCKGRKNIFFIVGNFIRV
jgi:hypothetical protein